MVKIVFITLVFARNEREKNNIVKTLKYLNAYGLPIFAVNESTTKYSLKQELKDLKNVRILQASGISKRLRLAGNEAAKVADYIFYLEGDKYEFVKNNVGTILEKIAKNPRGIWLPGRTATSFNRYPKFQKSVERSINEVLAGVIGIKGDYCYGPRIFPAELIKYFDRLKSDIDWGWQSFIVVLSKRLKIPIRFIYSDLTAPLDVTNGLELKLFRLEGFRQYLIGVEEALKIKL